MKAGGGNQRGGRAHESLVSLSVLAPVTSDQSMTMSGFYVPVVVGFYNYFFVLFHETFVLQLLLFIRLTNEKKTSQDPSALITFLKTRKT